MLLTIFLLAVLLHFTTATQKACHWGDPKVGLDTIYVGNVCPPSDRVKEDKTCPVKYILGQDPACDSFCQVRTHFYYGGEQPYLSQGYFSGTGSFAFSPDLPQIYLGDRRLSVMKDSRVLGHGGKSESKTEYLRIILVN